MSETLHTCPTCQTTGFTTKGLAAHKCKGVNRNAAAVVVTEDRPKDPAWDAIRQTISQVRAAGRAYLFGKAWLGWQLSVRKAEHHKAGGGGRGGDRKSMGQIVPLISWEEIVDRETGLNKRAADRMIELFEATKAKLKREQKKAKVPAQKDALTILQSENPLALPPEQREFVQDVIASLCDGETASSLMEELGVIKPPPAPPIGKKKRKEDKLTPEQLAFDFFDGPASAIINARASKQYKKLLYMLPPVTDDPDKPSLVFLRDEMQAMVDDLNEALAAHAKKANPKC